MKATTATLAQSDVDRVTVLRLGGGLGQEGVEAVAPQFESAIRVAGRIVVVDLSGVKFLNTPGIGMLLKAHRELQAGGKRLILSGPNGIVADVLRCCQFQRIMSIVDSEEAAIALARAQGDGGGPPNGAHVLVVEDDPQVNEFLSEYLRSEGFRVTAAMDGLTGMACAKSATDKPHAIVLDAMLPDRSGFEICHELKLHRDTNLIPVLMLTALNDPASMRSGLRVGANRYLTKPIRPERLLAELRSAMEHRREMQERHTHTSVEVHLQSDRGAREQLNDLLSELFVQTPLSDEEIERIRYAALEMIDNAAEWGNRKQKDQIVTISYEVRRDALRLVIADEGPGFDPRNLPHAANDDDPAAHIPVREKMGLRVGGFGIMITRGMVDEFFYNESGNQVTLVKYFRKAAE